jgi:excisionase family DNA binding protein
MNNHHDPPKFEMPAPKPAYTITEVANLLGVHRVTVSRFIRSGELPVVRLGHRTVRITHESLMEFLRSREQGSPRRPVEKS